MQSEIDEIRRCKTQDELDLWVQKNIKKYYFNTELQKAVLVQRYNIISHEVQSKSTTD